MYYYHEANFGHFLRLIKRDLLCYMHVMRTRIAYKPDVVFV